MKIRIYLLAFLATVLMVSCGTDFKKTKSGLAYKIFPSNTKDSAIRIGDHVKIRFKQTRNDDTVMFTNYDKMPMYFPVRKVEDDLYSPEVLFPQLHKGDSVIAVQYVDSLLRKQLMPQLPPFYKKSDRIKFYIKIVDVFHSDSLMEIDRQKELAKDAPRRNKEMAEQQKLQEEQMAKGDSIRKVEVDKDYAAWKKSGEVDKEIKDMQAYLKKKNINAQMTGKGTFVVIKDPGTGPAAEPGKFVTVKYAGRRLANDSVFESSVYPFVLGKLRVVEGWDEGIALFKKGGKGTLYIPGFLAYGNNPNSPFKPFEPLIFDVEVVDVKDTQQ